jgi:hypothetical protein
MCFGSFQEMGLYFYRRFLQTFSSYTYFSSYILTATYL